MNKGILLILDGYGEGPEGEYNAVKNAHTPTLDRLKSGSYSLLDASGEAVGLFDGDLGGSEVGHMTIGAGRVVPSTAKKINDDIKSKKFRANPKILEIANKLRSNGGNLHLVGLMSDKNIHSNIYHALEIVDIMKDSAKNIFLHLITDGRDTAPYTSLEYIKVVKDRIKTIKNCHILSISGRAWSMDREGHMDRTQRGVKAMFEEVNGINEKDIESYIRAEHFTKNDQFIEPTHVECENYTGIYSEDVVFFFNFREDRLRQIGEVCEKFGCRIVTMSDVGGVDSLVVYPQKNVDNTLSEYLSNSGLRQIKIGESTKYAHVTYFLNGGREEPFVGEDRVHVQSENVEDFSTTPKMKAGEITTEAIKAMKKDYDAIIVNYSNPDMVGHTGDYSATIQALEYMDKCIEELLQNAKNNGYFVMVTADHGNSDQMRTADGQPHMAHTLSPVFCVVADSDYEMRERGGLQDIAPTFVELLGLPAYPYFEGQSLIR